MRSFGIDCQGEKGNAGYTINVTPTLGAISYGTPHAVFYPKQGKQDSSQCRKEQNT